VATRAGAKPKIEKPKPSFVEATSNRGEEKEIPRQFERVIAHARRATVNRVLRRAQSDLHNRSRSASKAQQ
jgi:hypothetical protein